MSKPRVGFDLEAMQLFPDAARSAGISEPELGYGLMRLCGYCASVGIDSVSVAHMAGFFSAVSVERVIAALEAFGFVCKAESGWRVSAALLPRAGAQKKPTKLKPDVTSAPRDSDLLILDFETETGRKYLWGGARDGVALAELLKIATIDEIRAKWVAGLRTPATAFDSVRTVSELRGKWNRVTPITTRASTMLDLG